MLSTNQFTASHKLPAAPYRPALARVAQELPARILMVYESDGLQALAELIASSLEIVAQQEAKKPDPLAQHVAHRITTKACADLREVAALVREMEV